MLLAVFFVIIFLYRGWFIVPEIIGGDWPYYFPEAVKAMTFPPRVNVYWQNNGFGGFDPVRGLHAFESFLAVVGTQWLGLSWPVVYKIGWFGFALLLSFVSPILLYRKIFGHSIAAWQMALAGLIYSTNTYILLVAGGGQMGVALAYCVAPLVFASFIRIWANFIRMSLAGLVLGFQVMIDPRIAYVTMIAVVLYYIVQKKNLLPIVPPLLVAAAMNAFWIVPMLTARYNALTASSDALASAESLSFFSVADFSDAISLLHPNWPENIFGKTYFLQPEFLVIPIIAFTGILTIKQYNNNNKTILLLAFLALLGAFLSKGVNPPLGEAYRWLFEHVPGFVMFRDPTKFYLLTALSYAVLIPFSLHMLTRRVNTAVVLTAFTVFWLLIVRDAVWGDLGGTFVRRSVPVEYVALKDFLLAQPEFFRTLWVPRQSRFAFSSAVHPAVEAQPLFGATNAATLASAFSDPQAHGALRTHAIRYVIVPSDPFGEIFSSGRLYDPRKRQSYEDMLGRISLLRKLPIFELPLYEVIQNRIQ